MKYPALILAGVCLASAGAASAKQYCGELRNAYGPFDYRTAGDFEKRLVESAHFTEDVQFGIKGNSGTIGGDLGYTLRVFPNSPRALETLIMLNKRAPGKPVPGLQYPVECWFERAVRFQPDDGKAWALYAAFLYSIDQADKAQPMLEKAVQLDPDNPSLNYNLGLAYAKQRQYEKALPLAQKAYQQGFPLPGLKQMLAAAGQWREPPAPAKEAEAEGQPDNTEPAKQP